MTYLERLKKINISLPPTDKTDRTDKSQEVNPFGSFVSASPRVSEFFQSAVPSSDTPLLAVLSVPPRGNVDFSQPSLTAIQQQALDILRKLYHEHQQRLKDGGHDGKGALVRRDDYWRALRKARINPDTAFDLLDEGQLLMQAESLYWKPVEEPA